jgi:hypothetical protein
MCQVNDYSNGGWNKHSGAHQVARGNLWINTAMGKDAVAGGLPSKPGACAVTGTVLPSNHSVHRVLGEFFDNTCVGLGGMLEDVCDTSSYSGGQSFYTPLGQTAISCLLGNGTFATLPLPVAQALGAEPGSVARDLGELTTEALHAMVRGLLGF